MSKTDNTEGVNIELDDYLTEHNQGWVKMPKAVTRSKRLTDQEYRCWSVLYSYRGNLGIKPSLERISDELGYSVRKIQENISKLVEKGFLEKTRRGLRTTNSYKLLVPEEAIREYQETQEKYKNRDLSMEKILQLKRVGESLKGSYLLDDLTIEVLKKSKENYYKDDYSVGIADLLIGIKEKDYRPKNKKTENDNLLKAIISYIKAFSKTPTHQEVLEIEELLKENKIEVIVKAVKEASKDNTRIIDQLSTAEDKLEKESSFWKQKTYKENKAKEEKKEEQPENFSDYSNDEDEDLFKRVNGGY